MMLVVQSSLKRQRNSGCSTRNRYLSCLCVESLGGYAVLMLTGPGPCRHCARLAAGVATPRSLADHRHRKCRVWE